MHPQMLNGTNDLTCLHVPDSGLSLSDSAHGVSDHKPSHAWKIVGNRLPALN